MALGMSVQPLHVEALHPTTQVLLPPLAELPRLADFYLAGSAALALHIGHRPVRDLDWMSGSNRLLSPERRDLLADLLALDSGLRVETARDGYLYARSGSGVALKFFHYPYPQIDAEAEALGLAVASRLDLGAMKLAAIISRGDRRDFVDLFLLCQVLPLRELLSSAAEKFGHVGDFGLQALKAMAEVGTLEGAPLPRLAAPLAWNTVADWCLAAVAEQGAEHVGLAAE